MSPAERLFALVQRHGRNLHSFMVLEPGLTPWFTPDGEAAVAYVDRGGHWVAAGGPLCAPERTCDVARAFVAAAAEKGRKVVFFGVSDTFLSRLGAAADFDSLPIGAAPVWHPAGWAGALRKAEKLRNRLRKAAREGVQVRRVDPAEAVAGPLHGRIRALLAQWTAAHTLPPMGFMVQTELFDHADARRYYVVEAAAQVVGVAVCVPIYGRDGWLLEDLFVAPEAPAGSTEALIDFVMRDAAATGAAVVSLGMVVMAGLDRPDVAARHPVLMGILRACGRSLGWLYNFEGLARFRKKLQPAAWEGVHLVSGGPMSWWTLRAVLMAFAEGWVPRFGLRVVARLARRWMRGSAVVLA